MEKKGEISVTREERIELLKNPKKCRELGVDWFLEQHKYMQSQGMIEPGF